MVHLKAPRVHETGMAAIHLHKHIDGQEPKA